MKICSTCGATYSDRIDFCFEDGAVLAVGDANSVVAAAPVAQPDPPSPSRDGSVPSMDSFDAPMPPPRLVRPADDDAPQAGQGAAEPGGSGPADEPPVRKRRSLIGGTPAEAPASTPLATITPPAEVAHVEYEEEVPTPEPRSAPKGPDPNRPLSPSQAGSNDPDWIEPTGSDRASPPAAPAAGPSRPASSSADLARASSSRANSIPPATQAASSEEQQKRPAWMLPVAVIGALIVIGGVGFFAVAALGLGGAALTTASQEPPEPAPVRPTVVPVPTAPGAEHADAEPVADTDVAAIVDSDAPMLEAAPEGEAAPEAAPSATPTGSGAAPKAATPAPSASGGTGSVVGAAAAPAPAAQIGKVSFDSSPAGATVLVDGVNKGRTPTTVELPYGDHSVAIELSGHSRVEKTVAVGASEVSVPKVTLEAEIKIGKVFVALPGRDGQTLYVDGRKIGPLPQSLDLTEGSHAFAVEAPDGTRVEVNRDVAFTDGRAFINL
jgi:hypothetical protein